MAYVLRTVWELDAFDCQMMAKGFLPAEEAVRALGVTTRYLAGLERAGSIASDKVNGRLYYPEADIADLYAGRSPSECHRREQEQSDRDFAGLFAPSPTQTAAEKAEAGTEFLKKFGRAKP